jgi:hypothetical protein
VDIFHQAGAVVSTSWPSDLVALLEPMVHEVPRPRSGHLFHPKVWVAQYAADNDEELYRVLVLSRNLTDDRSWDVVVRLDGWPIRTVNRDNDGLVQFVRSLSGRTTLELGQSRVAGIEEMADRLRRVEWELPAGASSVRFWPFGIGGKLVDTSALFTGYRHLIVSPFVTADGLDTVIQPMPSGSEVSVVSRAEQLDYLPTGALDECDVHVVSPLAGLDNDAEDQDPTVAVLGALHAKLYVVERGHRARLFVGSANATDAAFGGNVEMLCEIEGGPSKFGVSAMMGEKSPFRTLLEPYTAPAEPAQDLEAEAGRRLESYLVDVAQIPFRIDALEDAVGWRPIVSSGTGLPAASFEPALLVGPLNRPAERHLVDAGAVVHVELSPRPGTDLTPFLLLHARATVDGVRVERSTVVRAALFGGPTDRLEEILANQIDTPEKFIRFVLLLLGLGAEGMGATVAGGSTLLGSWSQGGGSGLFELVVRALAVDPGAIDRLDDIVTRLGRRANGHEILPEGWTQLWATVRAAANLIDDSEIGS